MSKRLDILGARIFGASVCHAQKYLQPFRKCPNIWTKSPILAIMHKCKPCIIRTKACICAFCYFVDFLHTFLDIFRNRIKYIFNCPDSGGVVLDKLDSYNIMVFRTYFLSFGIL